MQRLLLRLMFCAVFLAIPVGHSAAEPSCEAKINAIIYRAEFLKTFKKDEANAYSKLRNKWAPRISYSSRWVPKEAQNTREQLYKYDALRVTSEKEITTQIKNYQYLSLAKLQCKSSRTASLIKELVTANARIEQNKKAETKFANNDFKKSSDTMLDILHKERHAHPKATHPTLTVKKE